MKSSVAVALAAVILTSSLGGCASIIRGSSQNVAIITPPITGAICTLTNPRGTWRVTTPGSVRVKRSKEDMQVNCTKPGFTNGFGVISSDFEGWTLGNLVIGGPIGLGVDAMTGAVNSYQRSFPVPMTPTGAVPAPTLVFPPNS